MTVLDPDAGETRPGSIITRRSLVTAAAGLAVAAGDLLPPLHSRGVSAGEGANNGELGGRRGKNRRGRQHRHRHNHGKKKPGQRDEVPPPGRGIFELRNTAIDVYGSPFTFTFFYWVKGEGGAYDAWTKANSATPTGGSGYRYAPGHQRAGVLISVPAGVGSGQAFVDLQNPAVGFPRGSIYVGTGIDPVRGYLGQPVLEGRVFGIPHTGDSSSVSRIYSVGGTSYASLRITREFDSEDFIEFTLDVHL